MRLGTFVVRCGLRIAYGPRDNYASVTLRAVTFRPETTVPSPEKDRMRGTGGNRFIGNNPNRADLLRSINDQLGDLHEWAADTGRVLDLAEVTISTKRIPSGNVSVSVTADLSDDPTRVFPSGVDHG